MMDKNLAMILFGLLSVLIISVMLYFGMSSPILLILLAVGFIVVGLGIFLGFFKMISEDKR